MSKCGAFDDLIEEEDILEQGLFALKIICDIIIVGGMMIYGK